MSKKHMKDVSFLMFGFCINFANIKNNGFNVLNIFEEQVSRLQKATYGNIILREHPAYVFQGGHTFVDVSLVNIFGLASSKGFFEVSALAWPFYSAFRRHPVFRAFPCRGEYSPYFGCSSFC